MNGAWCVARIIVWLKIVTIRNRKKCVVGEGGERSACLVVSFYR